MPRQIRMSEEGQPRRRLPRSYFNVKPVKVGQEVEVTIEDTSKRGDGVAKIEGYIIFVPNTQPGEKVKIRISQIRPGYALAEKVA